jgi:hypothetical protein
MLAALAPTWCHRCVAGCKPPELMLRALGLSTTQSPNETKNNILVKPCKRRIRAVAWLHRRAVVLAMIKPTLPGSVANPERAPSFHASRESFAHPTCCNFIYGASNDGTLGSESSQCSNSRPIPITARECSWSRCLCESGLDHYLELHLPACTCTPASS